MNTRLSLGTFQGWILTCPYHFSLFDIKTGKKISGQVLPKLHGIDKLPHPVTVYMKRVAALIAPIKTYDLHVYPVNVEGTGSSSISVSLGLPSEAVRR